MASSTVTVGIIAIFGLPNNLYDLGYNENTKMELVVAKDEWLGVIIDGKTYHMILQPKNGYSLMEKAD